MNKKAVLLASWGTGAALWTVFLVSSRDAGSAPAHAETEPAAAVAAVAGMRPGPLYAARPAGPDSVRACIDVNTAGETQLCDLPGIGPAIAREIIRMRGEAGPFTRPDDLLKVKGIGERKMAGIRDRLCL